MCFSLKAEEAPFIHPSYTVWDCQMTAFESNHYYDITNGGFGGKKGKQPLTTYSSWYFCCFHLCIAFTMTNIKTIEIKNYIKCVLDQTICFWLHSFPTCWKIGINRCKCLGWESTAFYTFHNSDYQTPTFNKYTLYLMAGWIFKKISLSLVWSQAMETVLLY